MIADMSTVADAAGLERFALFGLSQGCAFSVRYAVENPDRVKCLVLLGGYLRGPLNRRSSEETALFEAGQTMIEQGWGSPNSVYRQFFTSSLITDATPEQVAGFDEMQRLSTSPENAKRISAMNGNIDMVEMARQLKVPTLVVHCRGDRRVPVAEGRLMASTIPGARFVMLDGSNHILLEGKPGFEEFFSELHSFLKEHE